MVEEEDQNNENETNTKKKDVNDMDSGFIKDNYNTQHSETTEDVKNEKLVYKNQIHNIILKESMQGHSISFTLILNILKTVI